MTTQEMSEPGPGTYCPGPVTHGIEGTRFEHQEDHGKSVVSTSFSASSENKQYCTTSKDPYINVAADFARPILDSST
jgi:hypothetical protein